jgi:hypothetical protein
MKTRYNNVMWAVITLCGVLASCSDDFLNRPPRASVVDATYYQTDEQVLSGTSALYSAAWKDYCDQANWKIGDVKAGVVAAPNNGYADYADFTTFRVTGLSAGNLSAYRAFYEVIGQANTVIRNINLYASPSVSEDIKTYAIAECRFMRATAYAYLVMNYGAVPVIEDNTKYLISPALRRNTVESVWNFIKQDYLFAAQHLTTQPPSNQVGRLTKWSAEGMLARTYLNMAGVSGSLNSTYLDSAKYYADHVITSSDRRLLTNYADLFRYPYDNNSESLFELEWIYTPSQNYQFNNTMISQITPDNSLAGNGDGWGGAWGATSWALSLYEGLYNNYTVDPSGHYDSTTAPGFTLDQRLHATFMLPGFQYPEFNFPDGTQSTFIDVNTKTISYDVTLEAGSDNKIANIKKYVIGKVEGATAYQDYGQDVYMLRLAEMYLIYAEAAVVGNSVDQKALDYFNKVHQRAGLAAVPMDSLTSSHAWDFIFHERVKEFAFEGTAWYDLVRRHYYDEQHVYNILNGQDRGPYLAKPQPWPDPQGWTFHKAAWYTLPGNIDKVSAGNENFFMPIPQVELSQAPSLGEDPVPYVK